MILKGNVRILLNGEELKGCSDLSLESAPRPVRTGAEEVIGCTSGKVAGSVSFQIDGMVGVKNLQRFISRLLRPSRKQWRLKRRAAGAKRALKRAGVAPMSPEEIDRLVHGDARRMGLIIFGGAL